MYELVFICNKFIGVLPGSRNLDLILYPNPDIENTFITQSLDAPSKFKMQHHQ